MIKMKISEQTFVENYDKLSEKLLNTNQVGGAWFNGSEEEFEDWAGDVLFDDELNNRNEWKGLAFDEKDLIKNLRKFLDN